MEFLEKKYKNPEKNLWRVNRELESALNRYKKERSICLMKMTQLDNDYQRKAYKITKDVMIVEEKIRIIKEYIESINEMKKKKKAQKKKNK